ncbi:arsenic resistance protein [Pseudodesulfovibrio indicus]|uniref:ACR3 family arsenite efflux pump ArsB n=1 Tax=Pseudodesulfovibrio indicus TaxID=1716143 RepID=A0A126QK92_9BACT|nr:bile acid:sodium symporter [Pseudodesulfovibrio indicus]AMK10217.1 arsenite transporter [Pseudodesulfovibrio indicus]TDT87925.1 ACR3 family arsenite efflux pump ArsB [Pseudodesulfovibrio indicus]
MFRLLGMLTRNLIYAIPAMMLAGFAYGLLADTAWLKAMIVPFTFLMVYPMMVTLKVRKVFEGGDAKAQILTQLINFGLTPFLAFGVGLLFFRHNPYMALGLLLAGLVPTSGMTISWTGFAKGNMSAAIKMTVIGLVAGSLATPFYVEALMGAAIPMQLSAVIKQIAVIVFLPMALGYLTQRWLVSRYGQQRFQRDLGPKFPGLSTVGVLGIVFVALALKARTIAAAPGLLLEILLPLLLLYGVNFFVSTVIGKALLPRGDAIALVYGSVMRNLSIALAIAINAFGTQGSDAALVIAMAYIVQVQSAAWYVRFTPKVFGLPEPEPESKQAPQPA